MRTIVIAALIGCALAAGCDRGEVNSPSAGVNESAAQAQVNPTVQSTPEAPEPVVHQVPKPAITTREEWGSQPDLAGLQGREHEPKYITIHHAGETWKPGSDPIAKLRGLQSWGKREKGWPDLPYHYLISPDGRVFEGRDVKYIPETNTKYDTTGHIGVHLWGNFEEVRINREGLESAVRVIAWLCQEHQIDPATIAGHMDRPNAETVCPGKDFERYINQGLIEKWVRAAMAGEEPAIELLPPMEGGPTEFIQM